METRLPPSHSVPVPLSNARSYWLTGLSGTGKSTLAQALAQLFATPALPFAYWMVMSYGRACAAIIAEAVHSILRLPPVRHAPAGQPRKLHVQPTCAVAHPFMDD